jgi:hypothetical protein
MPGARRIERCCIVGLSLAAVSCASAERETNDRRASLELGTGVRSFEPLERGQHAKLYPGNQGGHHVWLSFRARGLGSDEVRMVLDVTPVPPSMPSHWDLPISMEQIADDSDEDVFEFVGWPAQVLSPECAVGTRVDLELMLEDADGLRVRATSDVIADAPDEGFKRTCEGR